MIKKRKIILFLGVLFFSLGALISKADETTTSAIQVKAVELERGTIYFSGEDNFREVELLDEPNTKGVGLRNEKLEESIIKYEIKNISNKKIEAWSISDSDKNTPIFLNKENSIVTEAQAPDFIQGKSLESGQTANFYIYYSAQSPEAKERKKEFEIKIYQNSEEQIKFFKVWHIHDPLLVTYNEDFKGVPEVTEEGVKVKLAWSTSTEIDSAGFYVLGSTEALNLKEGLETILKRFKETGKNFKYITNKGILYGGAEYSFEDLTEFLPSDVPSFYSKNSKKLYYYLIEMDNNSVFTLIDILEIKLASLDIPAGWSMKSFPGLDLSKYESTINQIFDEVAAPVWIFKEGSYKEVSKEDGFISGEGYWIKMPENKKYLIQL